MTMKSGLYVVATPIGNLQDITYRAVDVLRSADLVLSEDTRQTKKLFGRYSITSPLTSYRDQNHGQVVGSALDLLKQGKIVCLVSDSGTPLISDPGFRLVCSVIKNGFDVVPIPGPSAVTASLSASGLPTDKFCFLGFLPKSSGKRSELLKQYGATDSTLIIYESPHRLLKLINEINDQLPNRLTCVAGEITKIFERFDRGAAGGLIERLSKSKIRGEYTVLVSKVLE